MIAQTYSKDSNNAYQTLSTTIQADPSAIFKLLATTEGITGWFPQLSLKEENDEQMVFFDMGDGTFEKMRLLDYVTDNQIAFEWATGQVEFHLEPTNDGTILTLKEVLPLNFTAIPQDFTGWFVQMKNIKQLAETGAVSKMDLIEIRSVRTQIEKTLFTEA